MNIYYAALIVYASMSTLTFFVYGYDKWLARKNDTRTSRVSERALLMLGFFGGWLGALAAQRVFHHKTIKRSFQMKFWISVLVHCALVGGVLYALVQSF